MSQGAPQNPTFTVDAATFEVCRPKVMCRCCQTVMSIQVKRMGNGGLVVCPACGARHRVVRDGKGWATRLESDGR